MLAKPANQHPSLWYTVIHLAVQSVQERGHLAPGGLVGLQLAAFELEAPVLIDVGMVTVHSSDCPVGGTHEVYWLVAVRALFAPFACRRDNVMRPSAAAELKPPVFVVVVVDAVDTA